MKRVLQTLALSCLLPLATYAQTTSPSSFTLDDCIRYALENSPIVKNARVDEQIASAQVKETTGLGLPQIDGSVSVQHNNQLPRFFALGSVAKGFVPAGTDVNGLEDDDVVALPNFFQLPSSGNASLSVNQLLFSSSYLIGLKAASTYRELATRNTEQTSIEVIELVTKAYYTVLINNERIGLFDNNIARVDSLLRTTKAMNQNGFMEAIDVDRIQVNLNNLKSERLKFENLQNLGITLLKYQMNFPMDKDLQISGTLTDLTVDESIFQAYQDGWDYKNRIEYRVLDTQRSLQQLDVKNKYATSMPTLSAFWNGGYMTQSPNISGIFKTETTYSNEIIGPDKWYNFSVFGVTLNVPIFSGLQRNYQTQQSKLALLKIENNFTSLRQSIDYSIAQNTVTYKNAVEAYKSQQENMGLADRVARVTKIKYEQGVGSNIEVVDAESSLRESQVNYYNALFEAITAKIDLDKAFGKLEPAKYEQTNSTEPVKK